MIENFKRYIILYCVFPKYDFHFLLKVPKFKKILKYDNVAENCSTVHDNI